VGDSGEETANGPGEETANGPGEETPQDPGEEAARDPGEGFLPLEVLIEACLTQEQGDFVEAHPDALVLVDNPGEDVENASFQTLAVGGPSGDSSTVRDKLLARLGSARWVFVLKRDKNKFASMVTVGRDAKSDMRVNVPSVSKFHAYFTHVARDENWYLADANSSNGTFMDGKELPPSHGKVQLKSGTVLRFGPDVTAQFYLSADLWVMLRDRAAETPEE
jgi:hypothetical protein